jgi:methionyl aminopeptidase
MIEIKTDEEIELLRKSNLLLSATLAEVAPLMKPESLHSKSIGWRRVTSGIHGGVPGFKGYKRVPKYIVHFCE